MKADEKKILWLLHESEESMYQVSKATGITQASLSRLKNGVTSLEKLPFDKAAILTDYAEKLKGAIK